MNNATTFRQLENQLTPSETICGLDSPLGKWYVSVRDKKLVDLTDGELCVACRQEFFLEAVVPLVIDRLHSNPQSGEMYDGELAKSICRISSQFWMNHRDLTLSVKNIIRTIAPDMDEEIKSELLHLNSVLELQS